MGDFPSGPVVKNPPSNAGDTGLIPGREPAHHNKRSRVQQVRADTAINK